MPTTTYNGVEFEVSSEPMPTRVIDQKLQTVQAKLMFELNTSTAYETAMLEVEQAILGWTRIDPSFSDRLNRNYPLTVPLQDQGSMDALRMAAMPADRVGLANPSNPPTPDELPVVNNAGYNWWPTSPRIHYMTEFGPLPYSRFMTDAEAYAGGSPPRELGRFIKLYEQAVPREFRRSDYGFVIEGTQQEVLQVGFIPFIQSEVIYTWYQVPYPDAVPWNTIESTYLKVNNDEFDGDEIVVGYQQGTLLFTKSGPLDNWYYGPGGRRYVDVIYYFTRNLNGWNRYLRADGTLVNLVRKNVPGNVPPYASADFTQLFNPGAG